MSFNTPSVPDAITEIDPLEVRRQAKQISSDIQQQAGRISILLEKNKCMSSILSQEIRGIEATLFSREGAMGQNSTPVDFCSYLRDIRFKNARIRDDLVQQEELIKRLAQYCADSSGRFEKHAEQLLSVIAQQGEVIRDLDSENADQIMLIGQLKVKKSEVELELLNQVGAIEDQTRIAASAESRVAKLKEVIYNTSSLMLLELDYQEEVINDLPMDADARFLSKSRKVMNDLANNIARLTCDGIENEMTFRLELEPDLSAELADLNQKINTQNMKIDGQAHHITEQNKIISELQTQNRNLVLSLEESNYEVIKLLDRQSLSDQSREGSAGARSGEPVVKTEPTN
ncbi:hypothetical protein N7452_008597 [Penicillium brevicompactum]|uniref:Uncharacterized protein n=1 Tax=Penicillium brevicompactum TaxID=5074 RepID=A0A9W9QBI3_PENBR|nr:hypothetical protein N7452_008597 [Penicillium brevicompactum]